MILIIMKFFKQNKSHLAQNRTMPRIITIILAIIICKSSYAQVSISNKDANIFLSQYINPLSSSIGATLNNGWYNTAKPHKLAGFDLSLSLNTLIIPKNKKSFNPNDLENFSSLSNKSPCTFLCPEEIIYLSG